MPVTSNSRFARAIPRALVAFRAACAPLIVILAWQSPSRELLAGIFAAGFASDVFDGVLARRYGTSTSALRHADTLADTLFYAAAAAAVALRVPDAFAGLRVSLALFVTVYAARAVFEVARYGRVASYHMWSARLFGLLLAAAFEVALVTGRPSPLLTSALMVGIENELEGFLASSILPSWQADVPSIVHAIRRV